MIIYSFADYLDNFPYDYEDTEIERTELKKLHFPINTLTMINGANGLSSMKRGKQEVFNVRELIGYARMFSIPNIGYIAQKPIRAANILKTEIYENEDTGDYLISTVYIACAFMYCNERKNKREGQLIFICPFCGCLHEHGSDNVFGEGNGHRIPHCTCDIPAFYRLDSQKYGLHLDHNWQFYLVEQENFTLAGDFPESIRKNIINRSK